MYYYCTSAISIKKSFTIMSRLKAPDKWCQIFRYYGKEKVYLRKPLELGLYRSDSYLDARRLTSRIRKLITTGRHINKISFLKTLGEIYYLNAAHVLWALTFLYRRLMSSRAAYGSIWSTSNGFKLKYVDPGRKSRSICSLEVDLNVSSFMSSILNESDRLFYEHSWNKEKENRKKQSLIF